MNLYVKLSENGSFEISTENMLIMDCFPGIDGNTARPIGFNINKGEDYYEVSYQLIEGKIILKILELDGEIIVATSLMGFKAAPHWIYPIFQAKLINVEGYYMQGMGISGPSGYYAIKDIEKQRENINSYGFICFGDKKSYIYVTCAKQNRFQNEFNLNYLKTSGSGTEQGKISNQVFSAGFRLEKILSTNFEIPDLKIFVRDNLEEGLIETAKMIAKTNGSRTNMLPAFHWCSWYYYFDKFTHAQLLDCLQGFSKLKKEVPLRYIQIDAGYCNALGDWLEPSVYWPNGLESAFDDIKSYGYKAGIWIGAFMVGNRSKLFSQHPDWILKDLNDKYIIQYRSYGETRMWGYPDEEYYILDTSHPEAMKYILNVFKTFRQWGVEFFKTDFMYWGLQDSTEVKRYTPGKTSVEYFREFLKAIREVIGDESYWLACIAPYLPFLGYADGMRISIDVVPEWRESENAGTGNMIRQLTGDNYMNNIYWQNDSDVMMIRDFHTDLNSTEVEALTLLQAISGAFVCTSDLLHKISKERLDLFKFVMPSNRAKARLPFLVKDKREVVFVQDLTEGKYILFFFNPSNDEIIRKYKIKELIDKEEVYLRLWDTGEHTKKKEADLIIEIPKHGCSLYFASNRNELSKEITNLWRW